MRNSSDLGFFPLELSRVPLASLQMRGIQAAQGWEVLQSRRRSIRVSLLMLVLPFAFSLKNRVMLTPPT